MSFSAFSAGLINFDAASIDELDSLYDGEYEHSGTSYPNVIRMSKHLYENLNMGDHAIIRHFQMDENEYVLLTKTHIPFAIGQRGVGGFLHNESMSVSLIPCCLIWSKMSDYLILDLNRLGDTQRIKYITRNTVVD